MLHYGRTPLHGQAVDKLYDGIHGRAYSLIRSLSTTNCPPTDTNIAEPNILTRHVMFLLGCALATARTRARLVYILSVLQNMAITKKITKKLFISDTALVYKSPV